MYSFCQNSGFQQNSLIIIKMFIIISVMKRRYLLLRKSYENSQHNFYAHYNTYENSTITILESNWRIKTRHGHHVIAAIRIQWMFEVGWIRKDVNAFTCPTDKPTNHRVHGLWNTLTFYQLSVQSYMNMIYENVSIIFDFVDVKLIKIWVP